MNTPPLEKGVALILAGPQGCGKTRLAQLIGKRHGRVLSIGGHDVAGEALLNVLASHPDVVIIEEMPRDLNTIAKLKSMITRDTVEIRAPYEKTMRAVRVPHFIFCTNEHVPPMFTDNRRFRVVNMPARTMA